jgi:hypothetical protein
MVLQSSPDLAVWSDLSTNTQFTGDWLTTTPASAGRLFYRALRK